MSKESNNGDREKFASRLGFILVSAGCAIGLGNVWKFPYICGQNGGAIFIVIYLLCLLLLGYPILTCEFAIGRGSGKSVGSALKELAPKGGNWHKFSWYAYAGNYLLMKGDLESRDIVDLMRKTFAFIADFEGEVPGAAPKDCGNWLLHDLPMARWEARKFLTEVLENIKEENLNYPQ